ncbi:hypothetical protein GP486_001800 [Trichoglossum hirsutum]|uniref:Uncharacterized protein n=1 Tax=Trichoglossum hirsutum TaxID=265104 RepID=A0A9P8RSC7_9PEZI|nr:hypothetical protein GP486_001800 [Trichoglossum hirsutum]
METTLHMQLLKAIPPEVRPELAEALADGINEVAFGVEMADEDVMLSRPASGKMCFEEMLKVGKKPQVGRPMALVDGQVRRKYHEDCYGLEDLK